MRAAYLEHGAAAAARGARARADMAAKFGRRAVAKLVVGELRRIVRAQGGRGGGGLLAGVRQEEEEEKEEEVVVVVVEEEESTLVKTRSGASRAEGGATMCARQPKV